MKNTKSRRGRSVENLKSGSPVRTNKSKRRGKSLSVDRESSVSPSGGREVRCACQYYQSDSLLPERVSLFGSRSPIRDSYVDMAHPEGDHEYEPVNPPQSRSELKPEIDLTKPSSVSSIPEHERRLLRIPLDSELVVGTEDEDDKQESEAQALAIQEEIENRYLSATPTTTETQSRTECDVNTSMLDSSGLEDLPLKRGSRDRKTLNSKSKTEQMRAHAQGIQNRIRSQAGKLRSKLKSIPRPSFNMKERPKLNLAERPKFKLPERPKFTLPERPKFNFPNRPKINLPSFGKSKQERNASTASNSGSRKNIFDIDFKAYPKIFNKKFKKRGDYATSSPKQTRGRTPPPKMLAQQEQQLPSAPDRKKGPVGQRWVNRFDDIKYADENGSEYKDNDSRISNRSESISEFRDKDFGYTEEIDEARLPPGRRTISTKSSMSHLSDREVQSSGSSEERHRKGVLEEIDSDEFFLRQKGISQDDVNMERYLTDEIREAFRAPVVNALTQMDYHYESENKEPVKPSRTRSLRKKSKSESLDDNERFRMYPPNRPLRKSRSRSKSNIIPQEPVRYENIQVEQEYYKTPTELYQVPSSNQPVESPIPLKRRSTKDKTNNDGGWVEVEIETSVEELEPRTPEPLKRKKSRKESINEEQQQQQSSVEVTKDDVTAEPVKVAEIIKDPEYIIPRSPEEIEAPPLPPKRTRSRSRGSRSLHSLVLEEDRVQVQVEVHRSEELTLANHYELDDASSFGYATVGKPVEHKPIQPKRQKPPRPPPPRQKREGKSYNTLPARFPKTRVPIRPARYSTLGPSRPPRHRIPTSTSSVEHIYIDDVQSQSYVQVQESLKPLEREDLHGSNKDLKKEEVIEKMKVRPLPPPPRPPRHRSKTGEDEFADDGMTDFSDEAKISLALLKGELGPELQPGSEMVEEVSIAIQTDPIPDEFCDDFDEEEIIQELSHEDHRRQQEFMADLEKHSTEEVESQISATERLTVEASAPEPKIKPSEQLRIEEAKRQEEQRQIEEAQRQEQQRKIEEAIKKQEEQKRVEELKRQEELRKMEEAKRQEEQRRIEEAKRLEEVRKIEETKRWEEQRKVEEAKRQEELRRLDEQRRNEELSRIEEQRRETEEAREREVLETQRREIGSRPERRQKEGKNQLEVAESDMGYASLDRRSKKLDSPDRCVDGPSTSAVETIRTDRMQVDQLDVNRLRVNELEAINVHINNLRGNAMNLGEVNTDSGNLVLRNIELPPDFIQQLIAKIPWEELRQSPSMQLPTPAEIVPAEVIRPQRRHQRITESEEEPAHASRRHRRHHRQARYSTDEEEGHVVPVHRRHRVSDHSVTELSRQLARACTAAGLRAMRQFTSYVTLQGECAEDKRRQMQTILCVLLVLVAGFILIGMGDKDDVHHHHWDFQFPPQPPPQA